MDLVVKQFCIWRTEKTEIIDTQCNQLQMIVWNWANGLLKRKVYRKGYLFKRDDMVLVS
jgi:hypothetical protein